MFWASLWEKNEVTRIYLNAINQRAKIWVEQVPESEDFRIKYKLDNKAHKHSQFALPLSLNNNDSQPLSLAAKSFEVWQNSQNKKFEKWSDIYKYVLAERKKVDYNEKPAANNS